MAKYTRPQRQHDAKLPELGLEPCNLDFPANSALGLRPWSPPLPASRPGAGYRASPRPALGSVMFVMEPDDHETPPSDTPHTTTQPIANPLDWGSSGFEWGREHEASLRTILTAMYDDGTGDIAAGFLRHHAHDL